MAEQSNDFNKEYLEEKIQAIGEKLGDAYGQPLMEELIMRMERTVSHFNDEVDAMIDLLKSRTKNQRYLLASMRGEDPDAEPEEISELEKKLESGDFKEKKSTEQPSQEEKPKKKFSLFKRKKKK
ncbi:MAG: hypothetical protein VYA76_01060 [Candidatus Neomarinimicrobiota bacterium]|jgi:hypothetical protein|nr:hypothetical protein [Candidatus Neomarinimicrobiota bacterium]|tara:strand:+ start:281 stop:655 length:375 start_codon:yes stop_codon:yes gene_type:complete